MQIEVRSRSANSTVQTQLRQYRISSLNSGIDTVESLPLQKPPHPSPHLDEDDRACGMGGRKVGRPTQGRVNLLIRSESIQQRERTRGARTYGAERACVLECFQWPVQYGTGMRGRD